MSTDLRERAQHLRDRLPVRRRPDPPEEQGRRLATLERPRDDAEIRIDWCEYQGHPYLSLRAWVKGAGGRLWPDKHRGFSIRLRELPDVARAIAEALDLAEDHLSRSPAPDVRCAAKPARAGRTFDEFAAN
jgi:hypothetical protein